MLKHYNAIVFFGLSAMFLFLGISKTISHGSVWTVAMIVLGALILTLGIVFRIALKSKGRPAGIDYVKKSLPFCILADCVLCVVYFCFLTPHPLSVCFSVAGFPAWLGWVLIAVMFLSALFLFSSRPLYVSLYILSGFEPENMQVQKDYCLVRNLRTVSTCLVWLTGAILILFTYLRIPAYLVRENADGFASLVTCFMTCLLMPYWGKTSVSF